MTTNELIDTQESTWYSPQMLAAFADLTDWGVTISIALIVVASMILATEEVATGDAIMLAKIGIFSTGITVPLKVLSCMMPDEMSDTENVTNQVMEA